MAMIKCPECSNEVSDKAEQCPKCAYPLHEKETGKTRTIEQTSKKLKKETLIGVGVLLLGMLVLFTNLTDPTISKIGIVITVAGLALVIWTKTKIWWYHK